MRLRGLFQGVASVWPLQIESTYGVVCVSPDFLFPGVTGELWYCLEAVSQLFREGVEGGSIVGSGEEGNLALAV